MQSGARVGISSNSHKAINNLLLTCAVFCNEQGISAELFCNKPTDEKMAECGIGVIQNKDISTKLQNSTVVGTTAWGFARDDLDDQFDYLFIDEAGQVSVADLIAMSGCARNLVLLGDHMQLGQPIQGTHPAKSGLSVLDYLMDDKATVESDQGIFLPLTYRMHSSITSFISEHFYEGKLESVSDTDLRKVEVPQGYTGALCKEAGIVYVPVQHEGNSQVSDEEIAVIEKVLEELIGRTLTSVDGSTRPLTLSDVLLVAPYNMQVNKLKESLGADATVGTIDKFQGQEAPVVILSMCASDAAASPRGLEFLLDRQRMNVALSRAQCLAVVVGSPHLALTTATSVKQMSLINLYSAICAEPV